MCPDLKVEIGQTAPFTSLEQEVFLNLVRTSAVLEHKVADALKPYGLTLTQYNVLRILRGAGPEGLCRHEVLARMLTPVPDASRLLDRLEGCGLVTRTRSTEDRRLVASRLTDRGRELLAEMDEPVAELHRRHLGHMNRKDLKELAALLRSAREGT